MQKRIAEHSPNAVIFYGTSYKHWWRRIAGVDFSPSNIDKVSVATKGHTLFVIMRAPTRYGPDNSYFDAIGRLIAGVSRG